jgi:hypothetical protein
MLMIVFVNVNGFGMDITGIDITLLMAGIGGGWKPILGKLGIQCLTIKAKYLTDARC